MNNKFISLTLIIVGLLCLSQCSLIDGGEKKITDPHLEFLIFNENESEIKSLLLNSPYGDRLIQGQLIIKKTEDDNIAIEILRNKILMASADLTLLSEFFYEENTAGPWYMLFRNKDTLSRNNAVSDSITISLTIEKLNTENPHNLYFQNVYELQSERTSQDRFLEKQIFSFRSNLNGDVLYGYDMVHELVKDSLGNMLYLNPYYYILNVYGKAEQGDPLEQIERINNVPSRNIPFSNYLGTLNKRFSFVTDYERSFHIYDSHIGSWQSASAYIPHYDNRGHAKTAITDSSLIYFTPNKLKSYNPYTNQITELHELEETTYDTIVQYDESQENLLFIYYYRETINNSHTGHFVVKSFFINSKGEKIKIFDQHYSRQENQVVISNFIKINDSYHAIVSKFPGYDS